ncbi:Ribbon-helix-helix protein, copG family [Candidatus Electrothrix aarhusensis]|uniref:Ribbon-helix-helix protein, copG family n=1 Tax=Candidatus Electrothrix aarhusensis TaxID=1859131 RepID=A0A444IVM8_9BACT|nr:Ribbon-helix-helix protein, copG family [Candidatus Electrothrix aarhusensis]
MITSRLDAETKQLLNETAKKLDLTKSELIRKSVREYPEKQNQPNAWEAGKDIFGKYSSGSENLSSNRKKIGEQ